MRGAAYAMDPTSFGMTMLTRETGLTTKKFSVRSSTSLPKAAVDRAMTTSGMA